MTVTASKGETTSKRNEMRRDASTPEQRVTRFSFIQFAQLKKKQMQQLSTTTTRHTRIAYYYYNNTDIINHFDNDNINRRRKKTTTTKQLLPSYLISFILNSFSLFRFLNGAFLFLICFAFRSQ